MTDTTQSQISIADLENVIQIIDVASTRGAFKGNELSAVGGVRDKIEAFIQAVKPTENHSQETSSSDTPDQKPASWAE